MLHVGDDWAADVVGAKRAGWRAAYLDAPARRTRRCRAASADGEVEPDLEIDSLEELEAVLAPG